MHEFLGANLSCTFMQDVLEICSPILPHVNENEKKNLQVGLQALSAGLGHKYQQQLKLELLPLNSCFLAQCLGGP